MELLIEFLIDLLLEGSVEISSNRKVPKSIRYPLIVLVVLFFTIIIIGLIILGILTAKENVYISILIIMIALVLLIGGIIKFNKIYIKK